VCNLVLSGDVKRDWSVVSVFESGCYAGCLELVIEKNSYS
jgi:hypothetical protein